MFVPSLSWQIIVFIYKWLRNAVFCRRASSMLPSAIIFSTATSSTRSVTSGETKTPYVSEEETRSLSWQIFGAS
jgi:hypothetical protein